MRRKYEDKKWQKKKAHGKSHDKDPVKAKKHLGQHFLKDETIAQKIGNTLTYSGYEDVVEIGPGTGVLTKYLLMNGAKLLALDLDEESIVYLKHNFPLEHPKVLEKSKGFVVEEADFLKFDLVAYFQKSSSLSQVISLIIFPARSFLKCWSTDNIFLSFLECSKRKLPSVSVKTKVVRPMVYYLFWCKLSMRLSICLQCIQKFLIHPQRCSQG